MSRKRVYIAGPISQGDLRRNLDQSKIAAKALMRFGLAPLNPMLSCYSAVASDTPQVLHDFTHEEWLEADLPWVETAAAVLRLPGPSKGADAEVQHAAAKGVPVYQRMFQLVVDLCPGTVNFRPAKEADDLIDALWTVPKKSEVKRDEPTGTELRKQVLADVERCVCRDRQNTYGDAEDNFADIAKIASVVLRKKLVEPLDAYDAALFQAAVKFARLKTSPMHDDNWTDLAGYAVCGGGLVKREKLKANGK